MVDRISLSDMYKVLHSILSQMAKESYKADYYLLESQKRFNDAHTDYEQNMGMRICAKDKNGKVQYSTCLNPLGRLSVKVFTMPFRILMEAIRLPFVLISALFNTLYNIPKIGLHVFAKKESQTIFTCLNILFEWSRPVLIVPLRISFFAVEAFLEVFATIGAYFNAKKGLTSLLKLREFIVCLDRLDYSFDSEFLDVVEKSVEKQFDIIKNGLPKEKSDSFILDYILPKQDENPEFNPHHEELDNLQEW